MRNVYCPHMKGKGGLIDTDNFSVFFSKPSKRYEKLGVGGLKSMHWKTWDFSQ